MDINEIAQRAGVSRATVSRYLNDGYVSKEKRLRIGKVIEETGYVPSRSAQQLRNGKTGLVGVIIPKINSQSVSRMVAGITEGLSKNHYEVLLTNTNNDPYKEVEYLDLLSKKGRVDGIILIATVFTEQHQQILKKYKRPLVVLGQCYEGYSSIYQDDYHAVYDITRIALKTSLRPAYLGVLNEDISAGTLRHKGFVDACAHAGVVVPAVAQQVVGFNSDDGYFGAERVLDAMPDVDTFVCASDEIAFGAMMCMHEYGRRVPEDVQITGVGDSLLSQIIHPSLSTVHLHYKTGGIKAAEALLSRMSSSDVSPVDYEMPYEVYVRNTIRSYNS